MLNSQQFKKTCMSTLKNSTIISTTDSSQIKSKLRTKNSQSFNTTYIKNIPKKDKLNQFSPTQHLVGSMFHPKKQSLSKDRFSNYLGSPKNVGMQKRQLIKTVQNSGSKKLVEKQNFDSGNTSYDDFDIGSNQCVIVNAGQEISNQLNTSNVSKQEQSNYQSKDNIEKRLSYLEQIVNLTIMKKSEEFQEIKQKVDNIDNRLTLYIQSNFKKEHSLQDQFSDFKSLIKSIEQRLFRLQNSSIAKLAQIDLGQLLISEGDQYFDHNQDNNNQQQLFMHYNSEDNQEQSPSINIEKIQRMEETTAFDALQNSNNEGTINSIKFKQQNNMNRQFNSFYCLDSVHKLTQGKFKLNQTSNQLYQDSSLLKLPNQQQKEQQNFIILKEVVNSIPTEEMRDSQYVESINSERYQDRLKRFMTTNKQSSLHLMKKCQIANKQVFSYEQMQDTEQLRMSQSENLPEESPKIIINIKDLAQQANDQLYQDSKYLREMQSFFAQNKCKCHSASYKIISPGRQNQLNKIINTQNGCSTLCPNLSAHQQRDIILHLMKEEQVKQQKQKKNKILKYIVNAKWWQKWCDYTNFNNQINIQQQSKNTHIGQSRNSQCFYQKPSLIKNEILIKTNTKQLKDDLIEFHDFIAVSSEVWKHINSWYSSDWNVGRYLKKDKISGNRQKNWVLELYPERENFQTFQESESVESVSVLESERRIQKNEYMIKPFHTKSNSKNSSGMQQIVMINQNKQQEDDEDDIRIASNIQTPYSIKSSSEVDFDSINIEILNN